MEAVLLAHDDVGTGPNTMLMIHGAYGDRTVYANQVAFFAPAYRVVTLDLRGHGETPKPTGRYSIDQFADDVAGLSSELGISNSDVVGHSMGGVVAVELAHRHPDLVRAIATLDSPSIIPGWTAAHMGLYTDAIHSSRFREVLKEFLDVASLPVDDRSRRELALRSIDDVPHHVVTATWDALIDWDPSPALTALEVPLLYVDHGQPSLDYDALRRLCRQLITGQTVGAGHRALQEVPDQVNSMLARFFQHAGALADNAKRHAGVFTYKS
jgi:pimeloyl-ACP methyl ester carboxylesterase